MIKRALLSVYDKKEILTLGRGLVDLGYEIVSTGGTARTLKGEGIDCHEIETITGQEELFGGRVKTLHPAVHAGILARRDNIEDMQSLAKAGFMPIDIVAVNLYPFLEMIKQNINLKTALEYIDIGGPTLIRAAAKNFPSVLVVVDPDDYGHVLEMLARGEISFAERRRLATKAFTHTAAYEKSIAQYFNSLPKDCSSDFIAGEIAAEEDMRIEGEDIAKLAAGTELPSSLYLTGHKVLDLRYGENPHQRAALYQTVTGEIGTMTDSRLLCGKPLSYNNILDAEVALNIVLDFKEPACSVIKHNNPCGAGSGETLLVAMERALSGDPLSAYGSIIACNRPFTVEEARLIIEQNFVEVIIAPSFTKEASSLCQGRWKNLRLLETGDPFRGQGWEVRSLRGGFLVQEKDLARIDPEDLEIVSDRQPTDKEIRELLFAWQVVKHVKSNAILLAKDLTAVGIGAGQQSRVDAARIAVSKAGARAQGAVVASDAMIPFPDTIDICAKAGVTAVIQPGGSRRDKEAIATANKYNIAMIFTKMRHFRH